MASVKGEVSVRSVTIKNGMLLSPVNGLMGERGDVILRDGRIAQVGESLPEEGEVIDATSLYVTPGFIDIHTHVYPKSFLGLEPDVLGLERGATTVLDAGSSGSDTYDDFKTNYIDKAQTKVFTLLNISKEGILRGHELNDPSKIDVEACERVAREHADNIVGIKARASSSVVGEEGLRPIVVAARTAHELGLPLFVHVGNFPPALYDVLDLLEKGDGITHAYHGKPGGIVTEEGKILPQALHARARGVQFDVGHGIGSFSFKTYEKALALGFDCDTISTDLHVENYEGPVYSIAAVMSKLVSLGESFPDAVRKVTSAPAAQFHLKGLGQLKPGMIGDVNLVSLTDSNDVVADSTGDTISLKKKAEVIESVYSKGENIERYRH